MGTLKTVQIPFSKLQNKMVDLKEQQYVIWPNFLVDEDLKELNQDLENRYVANELVEAAIKGVVTHDVPYDAVQSRSVETSVRKTSTVWLDNFQPKTLIESRLLLYMDVFRMQLQQELQVDLEYLDTEVLYARYPVGGYYKIHQDRCLPSQPPLKYRIPSHLLSYVLSNTSKYIFHKLIFKILLVHIITPTS